MITAATFFTQPKAAPRPNSELNGSLSRKVRKAREDDGSKAGGYPNQGQTSAYEGTTGCTRQAGGQAGRQAPMKSQTTPPPSPQGSWRRPMHFPLWGVGWTPVDQQPTGTPWGFGASGAPEPPTRKKDRGLISEPLGGRSGGGPYFWVRGLAHCPLLAAGLLPAG